MESARAGPASARVVAGAALPERERRDVDTLAFYESNAESYALRTRAAPRAAAVRAFARLLPAPSRIVDLGSGSGRDLASFASLGIDAMGVDFSAALATSARRRFGVEVVVADMRALPFADGTFDGAWASASLLHLDERGAAEALAEAHRVLRPASPIFVSMKGGEGVRRESCGRWFSYVRPARWRRLMESSGFRLVSDASRDGGLPVEDASDRVEWLNFEARRV